VRGSGVMRAKKKRRVHGDDCFFVFFFWALRGNWRFAAHASSDATGACSVRSRWVPPPFENRDQPGESEALFYFRASGPSLRARLGATRREKKKREG
jgi:hypothetical protein